MAQRNDWIPLTTGLARMEGENARYTRASDKLSYASSRTPARHVHPSVTAISRGAPAGTGSFSRSTS
jgi:hypothetical protein